MNINIETKLKDNFYPIYEIIMNYVSYPYLVIIQIKLVNHFKYLNDAKKCCRLLAKYLVKMSGSPDRELNGETKIQMYKDINTVYLLQYHSDHGYTCFLKNESIKDLQTFINNPCNGDINCKFPNCICIFSWDFIDSSDSDDDSSVLVKDRTSWWDDKYYRYITRINIELYLDHDEWYTKKNID